MTEGAIGPKGQGDRRPERATRRAYKQWVREGERANCGLECGECESQCQQGVEIIEWLEKADRYLTAV